MESTTLRTLTQLDHARLQGLLARGRHTSVAADAGEAVQDLLDASEVVPSPQVSPTVVTMYSQVVLEDPADASHRTITLCYPQDSEPAAGLVSVLSPMGIALLGLQVGDLACWSLPNGTQHHARVHAVPYQPEAQGDYLR